jgi:hypothetical protein
MELGINRSAPFQDIACRSDLLEKEDPPLDTTPSARRRNPA